MTATHPALRGILIYPPFSWGAVELRDNPPGRVVPFSASRLPVLWKLEGGIVPFEQKCQHLTLVRSHSSPECCSDRRRRRRRCDTYVYMITPLLVVAEGLAQAKPFSTT